jgi:hypothetical protein
MEEGDEHNVVGGMAEGAEGAVGGDEVGAGVGVAGAPGDNLQGKGQMAQLIAALQHLVGARQQ